MATFRAACWTLMGCGYIVDLAVRHHLAAGLHEVFAVLERHQPPVHDASVGGVQGHDSLQGRDALGPCSHRCLRPPPRSLTLQYGSRSRISLASMMLRSRTLFFMPRSYRAFSLGTSSCSTATMSCRCGDTGGQRQQSENNRLRESLGVGPFRISCKGAPSCHSTRRLTWLLAHTDGPSASPACSRCRCE